jgi:hypothetical protein
METKHEVIVPQPGAKPRTKPEKKWLGTKYTECELCNRPIGKAFIDGRTFRGPWAIMCEECHEELGVGLGLGRGQKYDSKTLLKIEG